jgi:NADH:ubiquinone oxidoreductase subunit 6 (subunit J)
VFGPQIIPFEVLGVLLTAALIGAIVLARRD